VERRTLDELLTLYQLEPQLRDIYVEGPTDRDMVDWVLRDRDRQRTHVYDIDGIEIPPEVLIHYGLTAGARSKVIALAKEFEAALPVGGLQATCIVDSDLYGALGIRDECRLLLSTDYADIEGYLLTEDTISKFLMVVLGVGPRDPNHLLRMYFDILREPFLLRMAGHSIGIPIARVNVVKSCQAHGDIVLLDRDDLAKRMLEKSAAAQYREEIETAMTGLRAGLVGDPRRYVSGHEFMQLFAWHWASHARQRGLRDHSAIPHVLRQALDRSALNNEPLFRAIWQLLWS
jgi:hypothetical protein